MTIRRMAIALGLLAALFAVWASGVFGKDQKTALKVPSPHAPGAEFVNALARTPTANRIPLENTTVGASASLREEQVRDRAMDLLEDIRSLGPMEFRFDLHSLNGEGLDLSALAAKIQAGGYRVNDFAGALAALGQTDSMNTALILGTVWAKDWDAGGTELVKSLCRPQALLESQYPIRSHRKQTTAAIFALGLRGESEALGSLLASSLELNQGLDSNSGDPELLYSFLLESIQEPSEQHIELVLENMEFFSDGMSGPKAWGLVARSKDLDQKRRLISESLAGLGQARGGMEEMSLDGDSLLNGELLEIATGPVRGVYGGYLARSDGSRGEGRAAGVRGRCFA